METSWQYYHGGMLKMRVNNNIYAQNSYRNLSNTNNSLGKAIEKLSSGLRINRAADDAAGLGVSEKLRAQISGLDVAMTNAQDGIAVIQTAEGALDRTHAILRRVRDLTESSANGDKTDDDRAKYQAEVDQLLDEIDRISTTTEYNTKKLLTGAMGASTTQDKSKLDQNASAADASTNLISRVSVDGNIVQAGVYTVQLATDVLNDTDKMTNDNYAAGQSLEADNPIGTDWNGTDTLYDAFAMDTAGGETETITFSMPSMDKKVTATLNQSDTINQAVEKMQSALNSVGMEVDVSFNIDGQGGDGAFQFEARNRGDMYNFFASGFNSSGAGNEVIIENDPTNGTAADDDAEGGLLTNDGIYGGDGNGFEAIAAAGTFDVQVYAPDGTTTTLTSHSSQFVSDLNTQDASRALDNMGINQGIVGFSFDLNINNVNTSYTADEYKVGIEINGGLTLQAGPNQGADHRITVAIDSMSSSALGIAGLDVSTQGASQNVMDSNDIDTAVAKVSLTRGNLGAMQNRLEHTIKNLGVTRENLAASESRIRDADMAKEMMEFTKQQIMQQTGIAMLAQSNLSTQSVLQLLG
jgi:flagellin